MSNGQLVEHLRAGIGFEDFRIAILKAFSRSDANGGDPDSGKTVPSDHRGSQFQDRPASESTKRPDVGIAGPANTMNSTPPRSSTPQSEATASSVQQVMEDRRKRLEVAKAAKDADEKETKKAVAKARREAASASLGDSVSNQFSYAQEQRKRKHEAKEDKERILRAIENDRIERKEKETQRRALAVEADDVDKGIASNNQRNAVKWGANPYPQQCSLQVRLFDGATIRGRFEPSQTLGSVVRKWIAEHRMDGDSPFTLKQILTPLPNRTITISEEEESLQTLGLLPSATLVMVPIQNYIGAYTSDRGLVGRTITVGHNAACAGADLLKRVVGTVLGLGRAGANVQEDTTQGKVSKGSSHSEYHATAVRDSAIFRTHGAQEGRLKEHQLYNGNQVGKAAILWSGPVR
ncbi:MAG: hypothetical protein Q9207_008246 [Kuettlingeria erythrocarpa]